MIARLLSLCTVYLVLAAAPSFASSRLLGPYSGHAPVGIISPNNALQTPEGRPKGVMMIIHGGGWTLVGKQYLDTSDAYWWRTRGYTTYDIDYRGGLDSLADVIAAYDHLRSRFARATICVQGLSAGGTLALLLAAERPSVACVITEGGISDITTMPDPFRTQVNEWALPGHLWSFSPVREARLIHQPVLMGGSTIDKVIPEYQQLAEMRTARPQTTTMLLQGKPSIAGQLPNFVHAGVTPDALHRFLVASLWLVWSVRS